MNLFIEFLTSFCCGPVAEISDGLTIAEVGKKRMGCRDMLLIGTDLCLFTFNPPRAARYIGLHSSNESREKQLITIGGPSCHFAPSLSLITRLA